MIDIDDAQSSEQVNNIYDTLLEIFSKAQEERITTQDASKLLAEERIMRAKKIKVAA